jgi:hypothetical protein
VWHCSNHKTQRLRVLFIESSAIGHATGTPLMHRALQNMRLNLMHRATHTLPTAPWSFLLVLALPG